MGMDVYGKNATSETGNYFRNNVWWWRPLWDYCLEVSETAREKVGNRGHFNDGAGLDAEDALKLASELEVEVMLGNTAEYAAARTMHLDRLPLEDCDLCHATGTRNDAIVQGTCNKCGGRGKVPQWETNYPFSLENVQEFIAFLKDSGGFEIC